VSGLKEAMLWEPAGDKRVRCKLCNRRCLIPDGGRGFCLVRKNEGGKLYSLVYGKAVSWEIDPIEKKPFFHWFPGTRVFSFATVGCNFRCEGCLDGETIIPCRRNNRVELIKAKEFDSFFTAGNDVADLEAFGYEFLTPNGWRRVVAVKRRKSPETVCEIVSERGKRIRLTSDHKVPVHNSPVREKTVAQLKPGDKLLFNEVLPIRNGLASINLIEELCNSASKRELTGIYVRNARAVFDKIKASAGLTFKEISEKAGLKYRAQFFSLGIMPITEFQKIMNYFKLADNDLSEVKIVERGKPQSMPAILRITPELMRLLGYFVGDGNYDQNHHPAITVADETVRADVVRCATALGFSGCFGPKRGTAQYRFGNKIAALMLNRVLKIPSRAPNKRLPWIAFNVEKHLLTELLSAYFTTAATIGMKRKVSENSEVEVRVITTSECLKTELAYLLEGFGIDFSIEQHTYNPDLPTGHRSKSPQWWVCITGHRNIAKLKGFARFLDDRQKIIEGYLSGSRPILAWKHDSALKVVKTTKPAHGFVYDFGLVGMDDEWKNHCFYAGDGILVHNCQNWVISQTTGIEGTDMPPERIVGEAKRYGCKGIAYTYTEPTIFFEYAYDTAALGKKAHLYSVFVTNGYMTPEAINEMGNIDASRIDLKFMDEKLYRTYCHAEGYEHVLESIKLLHKKGHIEVINLVIPTLNDNDDAFRSTARFVAGLDKDIPLHFIAFYPANRAMDIPPTSIKALERARTIGLDEGLHYVYIGNIPGHPGENTYCPTCGELLIERYGFTITSYKITKDHRCPKCGGKVLVWDETNYKL